MSLIFGPDGQLLVSPGGDAKTFLHTVATGRHIFQLDEGAWAPVGVQ